jgi:hypothetical protein
MHTSGGVAWGRDRWLDSRSAVLLRAGLAFNGGSRALPVTVHLLYLLLPPSSIRVQDLTSTRTARIKTKRRQDERRLDLGLTRLPTSSFLLPPQSGRRATGQRQRQRQRQRQTGRIRMELQVLTYVCSLALPISFHSNPSLSLLCFRSVSDPCSLGYRNNTDLTF